MRRQRYRERPWDNAAGTGPRLALVRLSPGLISACVTGALFAVLVLAVSVARAQTLHLPTATRTTLANGIRIVLMEYHRAPALTVNAIFPGGAAEDARNKVGTASMTAELLRKGTATRSAHDRNSPTPKTAFARPRASLLPKPRSSCGCSLKICGITRSSRWIRRAACMKSPTVTSG